MDFSTLSMSGFEVLDSPATAKNSFLSLDEFEDASPLHQAYCHQMTEEDYHDQCIDTTEEAVNNLITNLENNPEQFVKVLQRRRLEELENSGVVSFLKSRFMNKLHGENYRKNLVSESECEERVTELKTGMLMAFNYSQQTQGRRFSRRLAARRSKQSVRLNLNESSAPSPIPPPPPLPANDFFMGSNVKCVPAPPPCPPPPISQMTDQKINTTSTPFQRLVRKPLRDNSNLPRSSSMGSVHEELLLTNPLKRLRSVKQPKSPGGTPMKWRRRRPRGSTDSMEWDAPLDSSEPLTQAFIRIMEHKFRNVRTPSPSSLHSPIASPHSFTELSP